MFHDICEAILKNLREHLRLSLRCRSNSKGTKPQLIEPSVGTCSDMKTRNTESCFQVSQRAFVQMFLGLPPGCGSIPLLARGHSVTASGVSMSGPPGAGEEEKKFQVFFNYTFSHLEHRYLPDCQVIWARRKIFLNR